MQTSARYAIDWDGDLFICYDTLEDDPLNVMHAGLSDDDPDLVTLHWAYVNISTGNGAAAEFQQELTPYGIRLLHVVTGTNSSAEVYFGRTGGANDFNLSNGQVYTAVFWIRGIVGIGSSINFSMQADSSGQGITLTADWQKISVTFTASATTNSFRLFKFLNATDLTFDATGFMIVEGSSAPNGFNVGNESNRYDVLTEVRSSRWSFGKQQWDTRMPAEGIAELVVNNDDRRYSPEYSGSPLYGSMGQKRLMTIDVWHPGDAAWRRKFAGWAYDYQPSYGKIADHSTVIKAEQGIFRLREIKYRRPASDTVTADVLIKDVLLCGYVSPAAGPLQMLVGNSRLNAGYYVAPDAIMQLETGISSIPLSGEAWNERDNAASVIEAAMVVEQGWFFIDGAGMVRLFNRHHYAEETAPAPTVFDLDYDVVNGDYVHAREFKNTVRVTYYPTNTVTDTIWTNREQIKLQAGESKTIEVRCEYQEGKQIEVISVNGFNGGADDSRFTATNQAGVDQSNRVRCEFQQIDGRSGRLTIYNQPGATRLVNVTLKGLVKESYGGQVIEANSDLPNQSGTYILDVSSKLIDNEQDARNLAYFLLSKHERAVGEFNSISLIGTSDAELERILDTAIGDAITVSEYQTGHSGDYAVIGEDHRIENDGILRSRFTLDPLFRQDKYWILGTSALGVDTYLGY